MKNKDPSMWRLHEIVGHFLNVLTFVQSWRCVRECHAFVKFYTIYVQLSWFPQITPLQLSSSNISCRNGLFKSFFNERELSQNFESEYIRFYFTLLFYWKFPRLSTRNIQSICSTTDRFDKKKILLFFLKLLRLE